VSYSGLSHLLAFETMVSKVNSATDERMRLEKRPRPASYLQASLTPQWRVGVTYLCGYIALDWISSIGSLAPLGISPWNPNVGLNFALAPLFSKRIVPLLFLAPLMADLFVRRLPFPWAVEFLLMAVTGAGYAAALSILIRQTGRFDPGLKTLRDLIVLMSAAAASTAFVALSYVAVLTEADLLSKQQAVSAALQSWVGDMIGVAIVAPFALIFMNRGPSLKVSVEMIVQLLGIVVALVLVFISEERYHFQLFYVLFAPIIWMAVRGGLESVTIGVLVAQLGLIVALNMLPTGEVSLAAFQAVMLVLAMTGLVAGALVTERSRAAAQLRLHQDSLARLAQLGGVGELAVAIAHEINQPLMAAGTYARLVTKGLRSGANDVCATIEIAEKAASQVERAAEVVRRLRALVRLDQSGRALASIEHVVNECLELSRPHLERHNITARIALDGGLPAIRMDVLQIEQVLLNLVRNSIEAMSAAGNGGAITVSARRSGDNSIEITVRDTGPGFPSAFVASGLPPLSSAKADGLGIGLSLSRSIVEAHGGDLRVSGGAQGASVSFTLPISRPSLG